ncbi:MAG: divalent metal cation transporter [Mycobacterium sp.]|nr:divalent metal cation transporter [Mycobacterium sp.]
MSDKHVQELELPARRSASGDILRRGWLGRLGPGLISGAADVDPTTVATMVVVGSTTVYALSWLAWLLFPMLAVALVIATRLGAGSGRDLQQAVRDRYGSVFAWTVAASIVAVNVLTIAADMHAGGAAIGLLAQHDSDWFTVAVAVVVSGLLFWGNLGQLQRVLKYVMLCLLAYPVAAVLAHPHWAAVLAGTLIPRFSLDQDVVTGGLAMLGTTLTSYVYLWQTMEQAHERPRGKSLRYRCREATAAALGTTVVLWFILIATGATLGMHHHLVDTAEEAAQALGPVAGRYASEVFGIGLLVSALVALPVLLAATGHVVAVQLRSANGLPARPRRAPVFTFTIAATTVVSLAIIIGLGIPPVKLLVIASVMGGIATPVGLIAMMLLSRDRRIMEDNPIGSRLYAAGWVVTLVITILSVIFLVQQFTG